MRRAAAGARLCQCVLRPADSRQSGAWTLGLGGRGAGELVSAPSCSLHHWPGRHDGSYDRQVPGYQGVGAGGWGQSRAGFGFGTTELSSEHH